MPIYIDQIGSISGNTETGIGKFVRDYLTTYYSTVESVPWENRMFVDFYRWFSSFVIV